MNFGKQTLAIREAKERDMVDYLSQLGHEPSKVKTNDYWYFSPFRHEKTPSFKVNRRLNRWYDHGLGQGGNLVDFGMIYFNCTLNEFLTKAAGSSSHSPSTSDQHPAEKQSKIIILDEAPITSFSLVKYLEQRKIQAEIYHQFCREIKYQLNEKQYYGIGFKNDSGGYEIRNPYFKLSSSPKDITTFSYGAKEVAVFEGFTDFLSLLTVQKNQPQVSSDFVVLNSVSFFEKARTFMEQHEAIRLYLDNDTTGQNYIQYALSLSKQYKDESSLYNNYKDLNEWLVNFRKEQKQKLGQKLR